MHYLDNAATTPVIPDVADLIHQTMRNVYGNPSSQHVLGEKAKILVGKSRETIADALGCSARQVIFTGSGTEANNIALLGCARLRKNGDKKHIIATGYEHPSVTNALMWLKLEGYDVEFVYPDRYGIVSIGEIVKAITDKTILVTAMHVNNEIGEVIDVGELAWKVKRKNPDIHVHVDGVQAFCKIPIKLSETLIDSYSVSGHKVGAPKGIGALYLKNDGMMEPILHGGDQEFAHRPGTENVPYIVGFAKAVEFLQINFRMNAAILFALCSNLESRLFKSNVLKRRLGINCNPNLLPNQTSIGILNISLTAIPSHKIVSFLSARGVCVSGGSACSKGQPSHTLMAMRLPQEQIDSAIRISFSPQNTMANIDALIAGLEELVQLENYNDY